MTRTTVKRLVLATAVAVTLFVALVAALVASIAGRTPTGGLAHQPSLGLYSQVGDYPVSGGGRLAVSVERGLVHFELRDKTGKLLCSNGELRPSHYHKWLLGMGTDGSVWLYSGDIGTYCWKPDPFGNWTSVDLAPGSPARRSAPPAFVSALGPRLARGLSSEGVEQAK